MDNSKDLFHIDQNNKYELIGMDYDSKIDYLSGISRSFKFELMSHLALSVLSDEDQYDLLVVMRSLKIMWDKIKQHRIKYPNFRPYTHIKVENHPSYRRRIGEYLSEPPLEVNFSSKNMFEVLRSEEKEFDETERIVEKIEKYCDQKEEQIREVENTISVEKKSQNSVVHDEIKSSRDKIKIMRNVAKDELRKKMCSRVRLKPLPEFKVLSTEFLDLDAEKLKVMEKENKKLNEEKALLEKKLEEAVNDSQTATTKRLRMDIYAIAGWVRDKYEMNAGDVNKLRTMIQVTLRSRVDKPFTERLRVALEYLKIDYKEIERMHEKYQIRVVERELIKMEYSGYGTPFVQYQKKGYTYKN